jgi:DNA-binding XRE family transcriptional regulator
MIMNKPHIITSPSGDKLAVLPLADYERLIASAEDAEDVRAYDEAKLRLAVAEDELISASVVDRLLDGDNPVRVWREHRALSAKSLATKAGISASYLSQIENGQRDGSFETMKAIAQALSITLDDLA